MQVETSVHGQPVAGIVSLPQAGDEPTLLRSNTLLMQKVRCPGRPLERSCCGCLHTLHT